MQTLEEHFHTPRCTVSDVADLDFRGCTDYCELGPNIVVDGKIYHNSRTKDIAERIDKNEGVEMKKLNINDLHLDDDLL